MQAIEAMVSIIETDAKSSGVLHSTDPSGRRSFKPVANKEMMTAISVMSFNKEASRNASIRSAVSPEPPRVTPIKR